MRSRLLLLLGVGMVAVAGCCTPAGYRSAYPGQPLLPGRCDRCGTAVQPLPAGPPAVPANPVPVAPAVPANPPSQSNFVPPPPEPPFARLNPDTGGRLFPPLPDNPNLPDTAPAKLLPPQSLPSPVPKEPPPAVKETEEPPTLPADIPQFAIVKKGIASGQQPFPDGVKWLKDHGYKTVLHVRAPTETDNAAKRIFESRGLTYLSLEVGPQSLTKEVVDRFNQVVADEKGYPLFVFDRNSALAGALWYLHFRTAEGMSDEKARAEAARLGFKQEQDDVHRDMWLAVQNYLKNLKP
jgi:protein tyrosine phosphatase (PTP) superfamily phosphohydrolase (DUF442 family)